MTLAKKTINCRIVRWALEMKNYDYSIVHRSGKSMGHVDALSRCEPADVIVAAVTEDIRCTAVAALDPADVDN